MNFPLENEDMSLIKKFELEASRIPWVVSLAQWIPRYPTPQPIVDFLIEKIKKWETNRYSIVPWLPQLRDSIAARYFEKYNIEIDPEKNITITAWAIEAISSFLLATLFPEDEVILIDPTYASYRWCVLTARWKPISAPLDDNRDLNIETIKKLITSKTKAIIFPNPNNPTGSIFSLDKIKKLLEISKEKNIYVVIDEVYDEFIYDNEIFQSAIIFFKSYPNLVLVNSWSKTFGMTWWRIWYIIAEERLNKEIIKVHDNLLTCAPVHSQWAAISTFEIYDEWAKKIKKQLQERRDYTIKQLNQLKDFIDFQIPKAAYFVFPKFKYTDNDYEECINILHKAKLALVPGSGFWNRWKGHFRICFWRDFDDLKEWLERLKKYFWK